MYLSSILKLNSSIRLSLFKNLKLTSIPINYYHTTTINYSRRTGSKALEPYPRAPSKKQVKRRIRKNERLASKKDPKKEKLKLKHMEEQFSSDEFSNFVDDMQKRFDKPVGEMMFPDGLSQGSTSYNNILFKEVNKSIVSRSFADKTVNNLKSLYLTSKSQENELPSSITNQQRSELLTSSSQISDSNVLNDNRQNKLTISNKDQDMDIFTTTTTTINKVILSHENEEDANASLLAYAKMRDTNSFFELCHIMLSLNLQITNHLIPYIVLVANKCSQFEIANNVIDAALYSTPKPRINPSIPSKSTDKVIASAAITSSSSTASSSQENVDDLLLNNHSLASNSAAATMMNELDNDVHQSAVEIMLWESKVRLLAESGDIEGAIKIMDNLSNAGVILTSNMHSSILKTYVRLNKLEKAYDYWVSMHEWNVEFNIQAFVSMMKYCHKTFSAEKAFLVYDEMLAYRIEPNLQLFANFFRAVGTAPHFVAGYEGIMFDAMALMEGKEIQPDASIYNVLIKSFAAARDPVAAEYYYWEMHRKGFLKTSETYEVLFDAFGNSQNVGASFYGSQGRYSRPKPVKPSKDTQAILDVGPKKIFKMLSSNMQFDYNFDRDKRNKAKITDLYDDNDHDSEGLFMEEVHAQAQLLNNKDGINISPYTDNNDDDTDDNIEEEEEEEEDSEEGNTVIRNNNHSNNNNNNNKMNNNRNYNSYEEDYDELSESEDPEFESILKEIQSDNPNITFNQDEKDMFQDMFQDEKFEFKSKKERYKQKNDHKVSTHAVNNDHKPKKLLDHSTGSFNLTSVHGDISPEETRMYDILYDESATEFLDPFGHLSKSKGKVLHRTFAKRNDEQKKIKDLVNLLDGKPESLKSLQKQLLKDNKKGMIQLQDSMNDEEEDDELSKAWDMIEFGRAPEANYDVNLNVRRRINKNRARLAFQQMEKDGIIPTIGCIDSYLSVFTEARLGTDVPEILELYKKYNYNYTSKTYHNLISMCVLIRHIDKGMNLYKEMRNKNINPVSKTYGMLIESTLHKGMIVESLQLLEDATKIGVKVPERNLRLLRSRCDTLGIKHPNMPEDPKQWVKDAKLMRRKLKNASQRVIEPIRSALYY